MKRSFLLASLITVMALTACGKKAETMAASAASAAMQAASGACAEGCSSSD